jgi:hypothetical protein
MPLRTDVSALGVREITKLMGELEGLSIPNPSPTSVCQELELG